MKRPSRHRDLARRLPGIGTTVLVDRLRKLEQAAVVERRPGPVGQGVAYRLTERGQALDEALAALPAHRVEELVSSGIALPFAPKREGVPRVGRAPAL